MGISQDTSSSLEIAANAFTAVLLCLTAYQCLLNRKTINSETLFKIYRNDLECRKHYSDALVQLDKIMKDINLIIIKPHTNNLDTNNLIIKQNAEALEYLFNSSDYIKLREFGYHFEYIGAVVKNEILPFKLVFELIRFPDPFWNNAQNFIETMQKHWVSDFWEDAQYLQYMYINERKRKKSIKDRIYNGP